MWFHDIYGAYDSRPRERSRLNRTQVHSDGPYRGGQIIAIDGDVAEIRLFKFVTTRFVDRELFEPGSSLPWASR
jgi:hypothetical protein